MDKLPSKKLTFILEIIFVVFLAVFVAFTAMAMAISWEVFQAVQVNGPWLAVVYLVSCGVVFTMTVIYIARRFDDWAKS
jgi:membrane protein YdbS with pleckstrin-like domain